MNLKYNKLYLHSLSITSKLNNKYLIKSQELINFLIEAYEGRKSLLTLMLLILRNAPPPAGLPGKKFIGQIIN